MVSAKWHGCCSKFVTSHEITHRNYLKHNMQSQIKTDHATGNSSEYNGIRISSIFFLLLLITAIVANILISRDLNYESAAIDIAGRQRMLSQNIAKNIYLLHNLRNKDIEAISTARKNLSDAATTFNRTIDGFTNGGDTLDTQGGTITLKRVSSPEIREHLDKANSIWEPLNPKISEYLVNPSGKRSSIGQLSNLISKDNLPLLKLMNATTVGLKNEAKKKSDLSGYISLAALLITVAYFTYIVFYSLSKLKARDMELQSYADTLQSNFTELEQTNLSLTDTQQNLGNTLESLQMAKTEAEQKTSALEVITSDLERAKEESDKIFSSVDHGLCLLTPDFKIGNRVSAAMFSIFEKEHLMGLSFVNLMKPIISDKDLNTLSNYLKLQFQGKVVSSQLDKFNPLKNIEMTLNWDGSNFNNKFVGFEFERIINDGKVEQVLVTITDITETVVLQKSLEKAEEEEEKKVGLISELISVDQKDFLRVVGEAERSIDEINELLRTDEISEGGSELSEETRTKTVNSIFQKVHNIKGNSAMAGLTRLSEAAHDVEEELTPLRGAAKISGDDLLRSLVNLSSLRELMSDYYELKDNFFKSLVEKSPTSTREVEFSGKVTRFSEKIAKEVGKKVHVVTDLNLATIPEEKLNKINDIYAQLIRNSVIHGIETQEKRKKLGKMEEGLIYIGAHSDEGSVKFTFRDDGAGLDLEGIKAKAIKQGLLSEGDPKLADKSFLAKMIFTPGFSTQDEATEHAGRGIGMDVIKKTISDDLAGKMSMSYRKDKYTEFSWVIPSNS